jgi:hypothetical protein
MNQLRGYVLYLLHCVTERDPWPAVANTISMQYGIRSKLNALTAISFWSHHST